MGERAQALSPCTFGFSTRRAGFPEFLATGRVFLSPTALDPWLSQEVKPLRRALPAPVDYDQILIAFAYERSAQTGMFTNLFLHREQFGASFATVYKGNIIKFNNGLPILRRDTAQTRLRAVFLYLGKKGGSTPPGPDEKSGPFFHAQNQEVNVYAR